MIQNKVLLGDRNGLWWAGESECRMCGHKQVSVVPVDSGSDDLLTRLECDNCGNMTAEGPPADEA